MLLTPFRALSAGCGAHRVESPRVGGLARTVPGSLVLTGDLDGFAGFSPESAAGWVQVLAVVGFRALGLRSEDSLEKRRRWRAGCCRAAGGWVD